MTQKPNISRETTLQFLQDTFNRGATELTLLSGGEWSQAYSFVYDGKKYVLRWCNTAETFQKDLLASSFSSGALPVPPLSDVGTMFEKHYAISEFVPGTFLESLAPIELEKTLPALFNLFDALRTADISNTNGYGGWGKDGKGSHTTWKSYLLDVKNDQGKEPTRGWYTNLANSPLGTQIFDSLYLQFESLVAACPEARELIHSDLLNYNVFVQENKINGVIDWQCSLYGDALYDIAWFVFYAPWYPQFEVTQLCQKILAHYESVANDKSNLKTRLLCYQLHIGLGSIAYNSFKKDWKAAQEVAEYALKISQS